LLPDTEADATRPAEGAFPTPEPFPPTPPPPPPLARARLLWSLALAIIVIDQASKAWIRGYLPLYGSETIVPGLIDLVHVQNAGVAFGLMNELDHPQKGLFTTMLAVVALLGIGYYVRHLRPEERWARAGLSLILGGAIGNLIDRVRHGFVLDFMDIYWGDWHFWAFNVADAAITIGAILVFVDLLLVNRHASHPV
jgi:signal peptidase II